MTQSPRLRRFWFLILLMGFVFLGVGYQLAQARLGEADVLRFAQAKASEILKAEVKISGIRYLPPARIALQGIQMSPTDPDLAPTLVQVKQLILGYGLANLIRRDFSIPNGIQLDAPLVRFPASRVSFPFLDLVSSARAMPTALVIEGGEFHYPWGRGGKEWVLSDVQFKARLDARGRVQLQVHSKVKEVAQGRLKIRGSTDPQFRHYELEVGLEDVSFSPESRIPLQKIRGTLRISEKSIQILGLTSLFHDWDVQWRGKIENWQTEPRLHLEVTNKKRKMPFHFSVQADLGSHQLQGECSWLGRGAYPFRGEVLRGQKKIYFPSLEFPHGYLGKGEIDPSNGNYEFLIHRDRRQFQIRSNLSQLGFETEFHLDHVSVNHLDWVVLGRARFTPLPKRTPDDGPRFSGRIETDYFIVEFEPLEEFRGSFELSLQGMDAIDFHWGKVFHLGGRVGFKGNQAREDLLLRVDGFPLQNVQDFARRPVPQDLRGELEGKLKFRGEWKRPEIQGYFIIREGAIEKLDFDRAIIQFQGFPPYLKLYDSKIFKGRNTLKLTGAIDLSLGNFFHGIQIKRPDSLVIWKGVSAFWKEGQSAVEAEKPLGKKMTMGLEVGVGAPDSQKQDREESHAVLGPKVRF